jgi:hypothetical protein
VATAEDVTCWRLDRIHGQDSFLLSTRHVELAVTATGGMLGPVTFFPHETKPIRPYAVAPWAEESLPRDTPPMLAALRGDWFCSAFGENAQAHRGKTLPPHGETANLNWRAMSRGECSAGTWMRLGVELPLQGGRCAATTALLTGQSVIYQRHDLEGLTGPVNPGHHATLAFPEETGVAHLSFSPHVYAHTALESLIAPGEPGRSSFEPDRAIVDLSAVPSGEGATIDLTGYPARRGCEDLAIVCADPDQPLAWSTVSCPTLGYLWFALRDPQLLASTVLWFSNGGRQFAPWNGRHLNVLGIEDVTAFFHLGLAASVSDNFLAARGIRTCLKPDEQGRMSIPYIQGVARIPADFDRVATIEMAARRDRIRLHSESGVGIDVPCHVDFLRNGQLPGLELS